MLSLDFTWTAPEACPTQAEVVLQLSRAVDFGGKELPPLRAHAVVSREGARWQLRLETELDDRHGTRLLEAESCEGLARAATLVLALTLGEGLARREAAEEARSTRAPPLPPPPPPPPPRPPRASASPRAPLTPPDRRGLAWLSVGAGASPLGRLSPMALLGVGYQMRAVRLALSFSAALPEHHELSASGVGVNATALGGGLAVCLVPALPPLRVVACAEGGFAVLKVSGRGTARDRDATLPLYGLGPSLGVEWWLGERAYWGVSLATRFYTERPQLMVEGSATRERLERFSASALLGGGLSW